MRRALYFIIVKLYGLYVLRAFLQDSLRFTMMMMGNLWHHVLQVVYLHTMKGDGYICIFISVWNVILKYLNRKK